MNRIKQLRREKQLTIREMADDFSAFLINHGKKPITNVTVSRWENEKNSPSKETYGLLADYFGVSVDYLKGAWSKKEVVELIESSIDFGAPELMKMSKEFSPNDESKFYIDINLDADFDESIPVLKPFFGQDEKEKRKIKSKISKDPRLSFTLVVLKREMLRYDDSPIRGIKEFLGMYNQFNKKEFIEEDLRNVINDKRIKAVMGMNVSNEMMLMFLSLVTEKDSLSIQTIKLEARNDKLEAENNRLKTELASK